MDYVFSSTNNETILVSPNNESANIDSNDGRLRDEDVGNLFGQFPSPFLLDDDMIVLQHHQQNTNNNLGNMHSNDRWKTMSADDDEQTHDQKSADCKTTTTTKRVRKKRSAGKKDRHSKIHTAQGLRDRRMRLSLHIARKFFGLQDILGFDKASKTIEWLFSKSKKAIDQVTEEAAAGGQQLNNNNNNKSPPQNTTQSVSYNYKENMNMDLQEDQSAAANYLSDDDCEVDSGIDNQLDAAASNKGKQLMKIHDYIADEMKDSSRKKAAAGTTESDQQAIIREYSSSRDKARARARERTRDKRLMMINSTIQKSKQATNPAAANEEEEEDDDDDYELGLFSNNINNHYMMEESSTSHPLDQYSAAAAAAGGGGTRHHHHLYDQISSTQLILEQRSTDQEDHNLGSAAAAAAGGSSSTNYYYYYSGYNNNNNYYNGSYMMNKNFVNPPPAGWLNSSNTFLGFLGGGWDDDTHENSNFTENNYGGSLHVPNHLAQSSTGRGTGDDNNNIIHGQNLVIPASSPSNLVQHFQTQNQRD